MKKLKLHFCISPCWLGNLRRVSLAVLFLMFCICMQAQGFKVNGNVTDRNNEPIIGANVTVKGAKGAGAVSDFDGR